MDVVVAAVIEAGNRWINTDHITFWSLNWQSICPHDANNGFLRCVAILGHQNVLGWR